MIKTIFLSTRERLKKIFEKLNLITPMNEKPLFINTSWDRYYNLSILVSDSLKELKEQNIENIYIAEAGIGIGSTFVYLSALAERIGTRIVGFDSFKGFPQIENSKDQRLFGRPVKKGDLNYSSIVSLKKRLKNSGIKQDFINNNVELIEGYFKDSLQNFGANKKIFFLHLDVDLYSSYKICLEKLWNNVIEGGIICFDEYSDPKWPGAKEAVDEFLKTKGLSVKIEPVTNRGFVMKK
mgnify:CR=1 FL=1|tara:strand:+ start:2316 stop:3029 length:714 start_codon:yes stop_codon:yes gene_type:complete